MPAAAEVQVGTGETRNSAAAEAQASTVETRNGAAAEAQDGTVGSANSMPAAGASQANTVANSVPEPRVRFAGRLSAGEMKAEMLAANAFVSPSSIENSSNSLGEAMLLGVPCVASRVGGIPDLAEDKKEALLYDFDDSDALFEAICRVFEDRELCESLSENGKKKAVALFSPVDNTQALLEIYKKMQR